MKRIFFVFGVALIAVFVGCATVPPRAAIPEVWSQNPDVRLVPAFSLGEFSPTLPDGRRNIRGRNSVAYNAMVAAGRYEVTQVGAEILRMGGNAVDAAVAMGFALGVVEPHMSGIGGGGFATVRAANGDTFFLDFRETAPAAAHRHMFVNPDGSPRRNAAGTSALFEGGLAVAVPHEVAGLLFLLENYGTMTREQVITPAFRMAAEGWEVTVATRFFIAESFALLNRFTPYNIAPIYFDPEFGLPVDVGTVINNPGFARALRYIIDYGHAGFYQGPVAEALVATVQRHGGIITMEDLANVQPRIYEPVRSFYRGFEIISSPPPSSGGAMLALIMNMLEHFDVGSFEVNSAEYINLWTEDQKHAYAHRAQFIADPRFFNVPLEGLISKEFAAYLASQVRLGYANHNVGPTDRFNITPINPPRISQVQGAAPAEFAASPVIVAQAASGAADQWSIEFRESPNTTHLSVADRYGNMVSMTKTLNLAWGSGLMIDEFGFFLNNEMASGFIYNPYSIQAAQAHMVPVSSMSPTIVLNADGSPFMVIGTPGATRIFTTVAQVISRVIDHGMNLEYAVSIPYFWNVGTGADPGFDQITFDDPMPGMERFGLTEQTVNRLMQMGHRRPTPPPFSGSVSVIKFEGGRLYGMADPRFDGRAVGF